MIRVSEFGCIDRRVHGAEPPGRGAVPTAKQAALAARRDSRQHYRCGIAPRLELAAERARSDHVGMGLMNLVFKPIEWA